MELYSFAWWEVFFGGVCTLAIFSFLICENRFYRFFEHFYIGIATGIGIIASIRYFFWPQVLQPLFGLDTTTFPDATIEAPYDHRWLLLLLPMAFGSLYYFILSPKRSWLAQLVIGFSLGVGGGLAFQATYNEMLPQLDDSFRPLVVFQKGVEGAFTLAWLDTINNIVFLLTLVCTMCYFFFTFRRPSGGVVDRASALGRWLMMGCFGAFFGATIMARMALLVERMQFLLNQWLPLITR